MVQNLVYLIQLHKNFVHKKNRILQKHLCTLYRISDKT